MGKPWLCLRSDQIDPQQGMELPTDCEAVVLDVEFEHVEQVCAFFVTLTSSIEESEAGVHVPVFVAVLPAPPDLEADAGSSAAAEGASAETAEDFCEKLQSAQDALHNLGLDEIICKNQRPFETHVAIRMAIRRMVHFESARGVWESTLHSDHQDALRAREQSVCKNWAGDLWNHSHSLGVCRCLPRVDPTLPDSIKQGTVAGDLEIESLLGQGGFCSVLKARNMRTSTIEAVKLYTKQGTASVGDFVAVGSEVDALRMLQHDSVVRLLGVMHAPHYLLLRMELAGPWTVMQFLARRNVPLPLAQARRLYRQLAAGVAACHARGIAHCDLKPENLGLDERGERLKIFDFGCCAKIDVPVKRAMGTMPFIAPEALLACPETGYEAGGADVWASGVVFLEMVVGIGALSRMVRWPMQLDPSWERGEQLLAFFRDNPTVIRDTVRNAVGAMPTELAELLDGVFAADPRERWPAALVAHNPFMAKRNRTAEQGRRPKEPEEPRTQVSPRQVTSPRQPRLSSADFSSEPLPPRRHAAEPVVVRPPAPRRSVAQDQESGGQAPERDRIFEPEPESQAPMPAPPPPRAGRAPGRPASRLLASGKLRAQVEDGKQQTQSSQSGAKHRVQAEHGMQQAHSLE